MNDFLNFSFGWLFLIMAIFMILAGWLNRARSGPTYKQLDYGFLALGCLVTLCEFHLAVLQRRRN
jgi:hypothetical protein